MNLFKYLKNKATISEVKSSLILIGAIDLVYNTAGYLKSSIVGKAAFLLVIIICIYEVVRSLRILKEYNKNKDKID